MSFFCLDSLALRLPLDPQLQLEFARVGRIEFGVAINHRRDRPRSYARRDARVMMTPFADVPKRPTGGAANAVGQPIGVAHPGPPFAERQFDDRIRAEAMRRQRSPRGTFAATVVRIFRRLVVFQIADVARQRVMRSRR